MKGLIKGDTRSLVYSSLRKECPHFGHTPGFSCHPRTVLVKEYLVVSLNRGTPM